MWTIIVRGTEVWSKQKDGGWFFEPGWFVTGWFEKDLYRINSWPEQVREGGDWTITIR